LLLFFFAIFSFVYWIVVAVFPYTKQKFIERHMEMSELDFDEEDQKKT